MGPDVQHCPELGQREMTKEVGGSETPPARASPAARPEMGWGGGCVPAHLVSSNPALVFDGFLCCNAIGLERKQGEGMGERQTSNKVLNLWDGWDSHYISP